MIDPLNIVFDDFGIWKLDYRIKFSCLHIPQGHSSLVFCGYEVQMNNFLFYFERKSTFKIAPMVI